MIERNNLNEAWVRTLKNATANSLQKIIVHLVTAAVEFTSHESKVLRVQMEDLIDKERPCTLILDLSKISYLQTGAMGVFAALRYKCANSESILVLAAPSSHVHDEMKLMLVTRVIPVYPTLAAARTAIEKMAAGDDPQ